MNEKIEKHSIENDAAATPTEPQITARQNLSDQNRSKRYWKGFCKAGTSRPAFYDAYREITIYKDAAIKDYGIQLMRQFYYTSGARYEAARRHKRKNRISIISILVLTFYAMFFSMISTFDKVVEVAHKDLLALLSVFMSTFIAAFSVYEAAKRYDVRSENFLRSARLVQTLRDRLTVDFLSGSATWETYRAYEREYFSILDGYSDNHGNIDFMVFRSNIGKLNRCTRWRTKFGSFITVWWLFLFSLSSPLLVFSLYFVITQYSGTFLPSKKDVSPPPSSSAPMNR